MTRAVSRKSIRTRSGWAEIRVERRPIARAELEPAPAVARLPAIPAVLSLADDIAKRLRNRIAFPAEFWKGVE